ncbi:MAG: response regulator, partial [Pseudomonadota bacterium]
MPEDLTELISPKRPRPDRPLVGMTVLVVEDSRFDSEAIRLLCQRSGARLRRADSLLHARRHLSLYRPTVVMVDVGLPDGSGLDLIRELNGAVPRVPILMAISGDPTARQSALDSGAQDFLEKPVRSLVQFQQTMLAHLPIELRLRSKPEPSGSPTSTITTVGRYS